MIDDDDDYGDDAPVEQLDPKLKAIQGESWFRALVELVAAATAVLQSHGVEEGTVFAEAGRLSIGDPIAGALTEVRQMPAEGLVFLRLGVPDTSAFLDSSHAIRDLAERVRQANPNGHLLVLPHDWSFRTMDPEMARQFAVNMIAFVTDDELEKIGLKRTEATA